jgi:hypothetical protein
VLPRSETTGAPVNRSHCKLQPVPVDRVRVSGGFWAGSELAGQRRFWGHVPLERTVEGGAED